VDQVESQTGKRRHTVLWATVAIVGVVAAGAVGAKMVFEAKVSEILDRTGATAQSVDVDFLGKLHVRDLKFPLADGRSIHVAAIDGRPKLPFLDGTLEVSDVEIEVPTGTISMAHARVENAVFQKRVRLNGSDDESGNTLAKRIGRFAATHMSSPEVTFTQSIAEIKQKTVYGNVAVSGIENGQIASYSADTSSYDVQMALPDSNGGSQEQHMVVSTGAIVGQDLDAAYLARLYTEKAGPEDKEAKPLYGPLSVSKVSFSQGDVHFNYDEIRSDGLTARMPVEPLPETFKALKTAGNRGDLSPGERQAMFAKALSILDMMGTSNIQLLGFSADAPENSEGATGNGATGNGPTGQGPTGKRIKLGIDRVDVQMDSRKLNFGMNGLTMKNGNDTIDVREASLNGFDWSSTVNGLSKIIGIEDKPIETSAFTSLIPELGRMRVGGISVDVAAPEQETEATTSPPERITFKLANFEVGLTKPYNGIPTDIEIRQDDLSIPVPADSAEEVFVEARKLGFESFVFSYALSAGWDEPNKNMIIREVSLSGKDVGRVSLSGLIGGVTEDFFSFDPDRSQAALLGLAGREMKLTIKDEGLMANAIKIYALQNDMTENQVRGTLTLLSSAMLQQVAAEQPKLQSAITALLRFISAPGTLTVTAKSTAANGVGLVDLVSASENPMLLLDKLDIQATAE
jgi:hypothetical protein